jgi:hypothetical protein
MKFVLLYGIKTCELLGFIAESVLNCEDFFREN